MLKLLVATAAAVIIAGPALAGPNCTCRMAGKTYQEGEVACIRLSGDAYTARCEMNLNTTSWKKIADGCPTASLRSPQTVQSVRG